MNTSEADTLRQYEHLAQHWARYYRLADKDGYQAARIGLLFAHRNFDPERGVKFMTYATWHIRSELQREMCGRFVVRMPGPARRAWRRVKRAREALPGASDEELAEHAELTMRKFRNVHLLGVLTQVSIFDASTGGEASDRSQRIVDLLADELDVEALTSRSGQLNALCEALQLLDTRSAEIVQLRLEGETLSVIGEKFGISAERVRQLEAKALAEIRSAVTFPAATAA